MVRRTNKAGEASGYTFNGLGVRVGTELILEDNSHGYTDFHCQTPSVKTGIEKKLLRPAPQSGGGPRRKQRVTASNESNARL